MNIFAPGLGDDCEYDDICFYDERFGDLKTNWMQYAYNFDKSGLMNISKYAIDPDQYSEYIKNYRLYEPQVSVYSDQYENYLRKYYFKLIKLYLALMEYIPLRIKTNIIDLQTLDPTKLFFPSNVTFEVIYHTYPDDKIKLLDAQLRFENFDYVYTKDHVENFFRETFIDPPTKSLFDTSLYGFTYDKYTNIFMGDFNFVLENIYSLTSQFKIYFSDFFAYKNAAKEIKKMEERNKNLAAQSKCK